MRCSVFLFIFLTFGGPCSFFLLSHKLRFFFPNNRQFFCLFVFIFYRSSNQNKKVKKSQATVTGFGLWDTSNVEESYNQSGKFLERLERKNHGRCHNTRVGNGARFRVVTSIAPSPTQSVIAAPNHFQSDLPARSLDGTESIHVQSLPSPREHYIPMGVSSNATRRTQGICRYLPFRDCDFGPLGIRQAGCRDRPGLLPDFFFTFFLLFLFYPGNEYRYSLVHILFFIFFYLFFFSVFLWEARSRDLSTVSRWSPRTLRRG